jgi:hypothetical protein
LLAAAVQAIGLSNFALTAQDNVNNLSVSVRVVTSGNLPMKITSSRLTNFMHTSKLESFALNMSGQSFKAASFLLTVVRDGKVVEGEGWKTTANKEEPLTGLLHHDSMLHLSQGDTAILFISSLETDQNKYESQPTDIAQVFNATTMADRGEISFAQVTSASAVPDSTDPNPPAQPLPVPTQFCTDGIAAATAACGQGGIASFTCTTSGYGFTCKK